MKQPTVLVVDDDTRLRRLLKKYLTENGFEVLEAPSADEADKLLAIITTDVVIMDMMMPGTNGRDMIRQMRDDGCKTPILMLTAMSDVDDRIGGLEAGADDYLSKPFEPRELVLRLHSLLRRSRPAGGDTRVLFGDCSFDNRSGVLIKAGEPVALTGGETEVLRLLIDKAGTVVSREDLMRLLQTDNERSVDVQITRLRKKVETDAAYPMCVQTVRGQGYMLVTK